MTKFEVTPPEPDEHGRINMANATVRVVVNAAKVEEAVVCIEHMSPQQLQRVRAALGIN